MGLLLSLVGRDPASYVLFFFSEGKSSKCGSVASSPLPGRGNCSLGRSQGPAPPDRSQRFALYPHHPGCDLNSCRIGEGGAGVGMQAEVQKGLGARNKI